MHWTDEVAQQVAQHPMPPKGVYGGDGDGGGTHIINDSKTPSGRAHVGSLRGVLIHDAMFRALKAKGTKVRYLFGCDDYDPVDELPHGMKEHFQQYLGQPLCNTPAPPGSTATDMADHFIKDFWSVFKDLGVGGESGCEFYRMRDVYRAGAFNEAIDRILRSADTVREIYKEVSNADRAKGWLPFQAICENCGRIGTVECSNYDPARNTVEYRCRHDLVTWAKGCGHTGKVSAFDGKGKLPWKLEWVAKWATFPVTIEGAGEDHNTKGGSRDVAAACLKAIYGREAPLNIPYGFVLVGGKKMSSSKGLGVTAREMADFLPPEVLRFLMIRTRPKSQANFEPTEEALVKLFNELDRAHLKTFTDDKYPVADKTNYFMSVVHDKAVDAGGESGQFFDCEFQLVLALVQMPHLDIYEQFTNIKGSALTQLERTQLDRRIHAAKEFLRNLADPSERLTLQTTPPLKSAELTAQQRAFCRVLAEQLAKAEWTGEELQAAVFNAARLTPIDQPSAFLAFYRVLLDNTKGPKAGNFLAFLNRDAVVRLFSEVPWNTDSDEPAYLTSTAGSIDDLKTFLTTGKPTPPTPVHATVKIKPVSVSGMSGGATSIIEAHIVMADDKQHIRRVKVNAAENAHDVQAAVRKLMPQQIA